MWRQVNSANNSIISSSVQSGGDVQVIGGSSSSNSSSSMLNYWDASEEKDYRSTANHSHLLHGTHMGSSVSSNNLRTMDHNTNADIEHWICEQTIESDGPVYILCFLEGPSFTKTKFYS